MHSPNGAIQRPTSSRTHEFVRSERRGSEPLDATSTLPCVEERDSAAVETAAAPKPGAQNTTKPASRPSWASRSGPVLRGLMLVAYLALSWPLVLSTGDNGGFPEDLVVGVLVAAVLLMVVAAVALAWRRWRQRRNPERGTAGAATFRNALTSVPVVLVAFTFATLSAVGRQAQQQHQRASLATSDAVSSNPQDRDRGAPAVQPLGRGGCAGQ